MTETMDAVRARPVGSAPVVVGIDDGPLPVGLLDHAVREAIRRGGGLRIVHGHGPGSPSAAWPEDAGDRARAHVQRAAAVPISRRCVLTDPAPALLAAADPEAEIVLGDRHRRLGSPAGRTVTAVLDGAPCPVLVVDEFRVAPPPDGGVVAAVDATPDGAVVLRTALERADALATGLRVVHTWLPGQEEPSAAPEVDLVRRLAVEHPTVPVSVETVEDRPGRALIDLAADACLLVLGHRRPAPGALREAGSTAAVVLAAPPCPVLVLGPRVLDRAEGGAS